MHPRGSVSRAQSASETRSVGRANLLKRVTNTVMLIHTMSQKPGSFYNRVSQYVHVSVTVLGSSGKRNQAG